MSAVWTAVAVGELKVGVLTVVVLTLEIGTVADVYTGRAALCAGVYTGS